MEWGSLVADSSWLAVPYLRNVVSSGYRVYHQVRNPLEVLRSHLGIKFFARPRSWCEKEPYLHTVWRFDKGVFAFDDAMRRSMMFWVRWNEAAEVFARRRWRVEDVNADLLRDVCKDAGEPLSKRAAEHACATVSKRYNHKGRHENVTWADVPEGRLGDLFRGMAERYGYTVG
jgi:hypothetical protein